MYCSKPAMFSGDVLPRRPAQAIRCPRLGIAPITSIWATWFWPGLQRQLDRLVQELGLVCFEQFEAGGMLVERSPAGPPTQVPGFVNSPPSMRLAGGMGALISALYHRLDPACVINGQAVRRMRVTETHVELDSEGTDGQITTCRSAYVLLAVPPRLAENSIAFSPALPRSLARQWQETATWMAPHAKYIALYDTPFWREQGLSGEARSMLGPLGEIHDASMPGSSAALFGFFGVPAHVRKCVSEDELRTHCRVQLERLFGPKAATPKADFIKDWAQDPYTATAADQEPGNHAVQAPAVTPDTGPWRTRLIGISSEWSPRFPGYLAGAIEAASLGLAALPEFSGGQAN